MPTPCSCLRAPVRIATEYSAVSIKFQPIRPAHHVTVSVGVMALDIFARTFPLPDNSPPPLHDVGHFPLPSQPSANLRYKATCR